MPALRSGGIGLLAERGLPPLGAQAGHANRGKSSWGKTNHLAAGQGGGVGGIGRASTPRNRRR